MIDVKLGGIYRAGPMDPGDRPALVLVTAVDDTTQSVSVTLLSPDVELGTSSDLILAPGMTGLSYALLAESDIFGYLWFVQLDRALGRVGDAVLRSLAALRDDDVVNHVVAGPPLVEQSDPRWNFKLRELARLQTLTAHCTRELVDGERVASIDPRAFEVPKSQTEVLAFEEFIVALIEGARRGAITIPGWLVDIALDEDLIASYRAAGLYHALRAIWRLAEASGAPKESSLTGRRTLEDYRDLQIEHARAAGLTNQWLVARSIEVSGLIETRPVRTNDGRLVQLSYVAAEEFITTNEEVYA